MAPEWYDNIVDEVKSFHPLCKAPRRNNLGDRVIGYNHPVWSKESQSQDWERILETDLSMAIEAVDSLFPNAKNQVQRNALAHAAFYLGTKRFKNWSEFVEDVRMDNFSGAALELANSRYFKNDPKLAKMLSERLITKRYSGAATVANTAKPKKSKKAATKGAEELV